MKARALGLALVSLVSLGCDRDASLAPEGVRIAPPPPSGTVYPASQYTPRLLFPGTSSIAHDVNDRNEIVGILKGAAFFLPAVGRRVVLQMPNASGSEALAVSNSSAIGGSITRLGVQYPAYWASSGAAPLELRGAGSVTDVNDLGDAVGYTMVKGTPRAFFWEAARQRLTILPRYAGGTDDIATAINNDRVIVGRSDRYPVMWRAGSLGWTVSPLSGFYPSDIDSGMGTVGQDGTGVAAFGNPNLAGYFLTAIQMLAMTWATNDVGTAVGDESNSLGPVRAWVGDRWGQFTYLPMPGPPYSFSSARGVNDCGLVVGMMVSGTQTEAAVWNPGC